MPQKNKPDNKQYVSIPDQFYIIVDRIVNDTDMEQEDIDLMVERDETIQAGMQYVMNTVWGSIGEYEHPNEAIKTLVAEAIDFSATSIAGVICKMIKSAFAYGYSISEIVWAVEKGKIKVANMIPLPSYQCIIKYDGEGFSVEYTTVKGQRIVIPAAKCLILRNGVGAYGESILRAIYSSWQFKTAVRKWWAVAMEKYAIPVPVITASDPVKAKEMIGQWFNKTGLALPIGDSITMIQPGGDMASSFKITIEYLNTVMLRGLMVPQLLLSSAETGAYAMSRTHLEVFQATMQQHAKSITEQLLDQLVTRIIEYNVGVQEEYGEFTIMQTPGMEDRGLLATYIGTLVNAGVIDPTEEWVRDMLHIPAMSPEMLKEKEEQDAVNANNQNSANLRGEQNPEVPADTVEDTTNVANSKQSNK